MITESGAISAFVKYMWAGVILPAFVFLFRRQEKIKSEAVTRMQMIEEIDHKLSPIYAEMQQGKEIRQETNREMKALSELITQLRIDLASRLQTTNTRKRIE